MHKNALFLLKNYKNRSAMAAPPPIWVWIRFSRKIRIRI